VAISSKLDALAQTASQIINEFSRIDCRTIANHEGWNELGISVYRRPGPDIAKAKLALQFFRQVLFLGVAERPNFIALNPFAGKAA
jgi:hypothetical protein